MSYIFTLGDIEQLEQSTDPALQKKVADLLMPAVTKLAVANIGPESADDAGQMVGWMALKGKDALRMMPQYFMESLSLAEPVAYTFADRVLTVCGKALTEVVPGVDLNAIRLPWKAKVDSSVLKTSGESEASGKKNQGIEQYGASSVKSPLKESPLEDVVPSQGLRHQDAEEKLAIRVRMIEQLAGIDFKGDMAERFRHAVRPAIAGIKSPEETARQLALVTQKGGLGMGHEHVQEVVDLIERLRAKEQEIAARADIKKPETPKSFLPMVEDEAAMMPVATKSQAPSAEAAKLDTLIKQSAADQPIDLRGAAGVTPNAHTMHDVVARPLTMGPVDEIRSMTLTDFRRLAAKAAAAADKIKERLAVLREDGVDQYSAGIKAWRESPLYALYIDMVHEGLKNGQQLDAIVSSNPSDPARFTSEELQSIVELNKSLRF